MTPIPYTNVKYLRICLKVAESRKIFESNQMRDVTKQTISATNKETTNLCMHTCIESLDSTFVKTPIPRQWIEGSRPNGVNIIHF